MLMTLQIVAKRAGRQRSRTGETDSRFQLVLLQETQQEEVRLGYADDDRYLTNIILTALKKDITVSGNGLPNSTSSRRNI